MTNEKPLPSTMTAEERIREIAEIVSSGLIRKRLQAVYQKEKDLCAYNNALGDKI